MKSSITRSIPGMILVLVSIATIPTAAQPQTITLGEAVDNTSLVWTTGGDAEWFGQTMDYYYDGDAAQSGDVGSGHQSWIETTVAGPGILSFYWKVSFGSTWLALYADGVEKLGCLTREWDWQLFSVPSGTHTLRWVWAPSLSGEAGFLDKVAFAPGAGAIMVQSPNGGETWYHRYFYGIEWTSTEDVGPHAKLELFKGQSAHHTISASTDNDGYYTWLVPAWLEPGADYRIKVTSVSNPSVYDCSDGYFSIDEWYQSPFGGLLVLDGTDDYAEAPDHLELDLADGSLTVEAWVNFRSIQSEEVFMKAGAYGLRIQPDFSGSHCIWIDYPCVVGCCTSSKYLSLGWHHVALVYDQAAGQARAYYDGKQRCTASCAAGDSDQPLWVGKGVVTGSALQGAVDELRISSLVRYTSDFTRPTGPFSCDGSTNALWHFDEFEGATVFHDVCGATDNTLVGYHGAHTEGAFVDRVYLPAVLRQDGRW